MLSISDGEALTRALSSPIDERIKRLLALRRDQLGGDITDQAHFAIVQPTDTAAATARAIGFPFMEDPYFWPEWVQDHGFAYELCWNLTDDFAHVVLVPRQIGIDRELLDFAAAHTSEQA